MVRVITLDDLERELDEIEESSSERGVGLHRLSGRFVSEDAWRRINPYSRDVIYDSFMVHSRMDKKYVHRCLGCNRKMSWSEVVEANIEWNVRHYRRFADLCRDRNFFERIDIYEHIDVKKWCENVKKYSLLKRMWRSIDIEFYCCMCFDERFWDSNVE